VPREGLGAVVLVPGDRVVVLRRGRDVDVAVAVEVRGHRGADQVRERRDDVRREGLGAVALVPGDGVLAAPRGDDVDVAVAVDVRREDALDGVDVVLDEAPRVDRRGVDVALLVPDHLGAVVGRRDEVVVAVAVDVGDDDHGRAVRERRDLTG